MQALILAAGLATRLGHLASERPKCLLDIGGRPLIHYSLDNLVASGVTEIVIVTGHREAMIREALGTSYNGVPIQYVHNADYATTGSVVSLLAGAEAVKGSSVLVIESDILYHPDFADVAMSENDNTVLVADASGSGDEVYICASEDGDLEFLGKSAPAHLRDRSIGEFAGITRLSRPFLDKYCTEAQRFLQAGQAKGHYEELIFELGCRGNRVGTRHCPDLPWTEIDTEADLLRAKNKVLPQLQKLGSHVQALDDRALPL